MTEQSNSQLGRDFLHLHRPGHCFVMANAWDAGSAVILEQAGFAALGTTSAGIAYSHALADAASELTLDLALTETREIARAVRIPVSMDAENLYADAPRDVYRNMKRIISTGAVGASIEDFTGDPDKPFYDIELAVERIEATRSALAETETPFVLTARAECYLYGQPQPFDEAVYRLNRYREAGADCLYAPGLRHLAEIRALAAAVDGPLNVVMGLSGTPISVADLRRAGVARISIGGSLARATLGLVRRAAQEMLQQGSFEFAAGQIAGSELCDLFGGLKGEP